MGAFKQMEIERHELAWERDELRRDMRELIRSTEALVARSHEALEAESNAPGERSDEVQELVDTLRAWCDAFTV